MGWYWKTLYTLIEGDVSRLNTQVPMELLKAAIKRMEKKSKQRIMLFMCCMLVFLAACDRPFVEPDVPVIELVEPANTNRIFFNTSVVIKATASSFREVEFMEIRDDTMHFDETEGVWVDTLVLTPGLNTITINAVDVEGVEGKRDVLLPHLRPRYEDNAPRLPAPTRLGGHTATLLQDGSVLVTGGSSRRSGAAFPNAYLLNNGSSIFTPVETAMDQGRMGHTASLLPDGRVLILGGSTTGLPARAQDLVETALIFDPTLQSFATVPFNLPQFLPTFQRSGHVTFISEASGQVFVDIYGGQGPNTEGGFGVLDEIQTYRLAGDTLVFVDIVQGVDGVPPSDYLSSTLLTQGQDFSQAKYVVTGTKFISNGTNSVNFTIDFSSLPVQVDLKPALNVPRVRHSSTFIDDELVFILGGVQGTITTVVSSSEVYFDHTQTFFTLDNRISSSPRHSHTATKLLSERILIIGGFNRSGDAIPDSQYFTWR